jgi:hypothetical protein
MPNEPIGLSSKNLTCYNRIHPIRAGGPRAIRQEGGGSAPRPRGRDCDPVKRSGRCVVRGRRVRNIGARVLRAAF